LIGLPGVSEREMKSFVSWRIIRAGIDRVPPRTDVPRHQHRDAYATVVLGGAYEQRSYAGRLKVQAGDVLIQPTFDYHSDHMLSEGIEILRLPWRREPGYGGVYRNCRLDLIRHLAERDLREARLALEAEIRDAACVPPHATDWPDLLVADLAANPRIRITDWALSMDLAREHVSRGFNAVYGTTPAQFRCELNARAACLRISGTCDPLVDIAADLGFSDQAHMTRAIKAFTGTPPAQWRRAKMT
jgi:AraC-like DNA-binding protein